MEEFTAAADGSPLAPFAVSPLTGMMTAYPKTTEDAGTMSIWFDAWSQLIGEWWQSLGLRGQHDLWLSIGWIALVLWAWGSYRLLRRLAGFRRFGGRWHNAVEYQRLMQVLWEDQQAGKRVMSHAELKALREFRYGNTVKPIISGKGGGYFDV
jgi:hypothetical protein